MSIADGWNTPRKMRSRSPKASAAVPNSATNVRDPAGIGNTLKLTMVIAASVPKVVRVDNNLQVTPRPAT